MLILIPSPLLFSLQAATLVQQASPDVLWLLQWVLGLCAGAIATLIGLIYYGLVQRLAKLERRQAREAGRSEKRHRQAVTATLTLLLALQPSSGETIARTFSELLENGDDDGGD